MQLLYYLFFKNVFWNVYLQNSPPDHQWLSVQRTVQRIKKTSPEKQIYEVNAKYPYDFCWNISFMLVNGFWIAFWHIKLIIVVRADRFNV